MAAMPEWKVKRGEQEFTAASVGMLREWATSGRVLGADLVFHPVLERWMYAKELAELAAFFPQAPQVVITKPATSLVTKGCAILLAIAGLFALLILLGPTIFGH